MGKFVIKTTCGKNATIPRKNVSAGDPERENVNGKHIHIVLPELPAQ
jgi:hypothetical protein